MIADTLIQLYTNSCNAGRLHGRALRDRREPLPRRGPWRAEENRNVIVRRRRAARRGHRARRRRCGRSPPTRRVCQALPPDVAVARRYLGLVSRRAKLFTATGVVVALAISAIAVAVARPGGEGRSPQVAAASAVEQRFAELSRASSNQCGLQAEALDTMAANGRLQGSCCSQMDLHRYREQVQGLRRYRDVPEIPRDPYDIPISLAKRLFAYQRAIKLTAAEQATYDRAFKVSGDHGPCCCRCWRWTAFEGQAKFLITRRNFSAKQIAAVWLLEDGCGGGGHEGAHRS